MRAIHEIATDIMADMRAQCRAMKNPVTAKQRFAHAWPYLTAMETLTTCADRYIHDSGSSVVAYGLANLGTYRGDTAKALKAELQAHLKGGK